MAWTSSAMAATPFTHAFAPQEGLLTPAEQPYRAELCLNGRWQFQPMPIPDGYVRDQGVPPELVPPAPDRWEQTPIKIPSPWNVNTWGDGSHVGAGTPHPYWPSSVAFPSYPEAWNGVEMGWLRRSFRVPTDWQGRRLQLHFESVAGECQVLVNGQPVGEHLDSYLPFDCDITSQVHAGQDNELLVGVRRRHLFNKTEAQYPHMRAPYAIGSNTDQLGGIWQDVYLQALPPVHVTDTFIQPQVDRDMLTVEATLTNTTNQPQQVMVAGSVAPWVNLAGTSILDAPEPKWKLAAPMLALPSTPATIPPGQTVRVTLQAPVQGRLKLWSPAMPNLNGLVLSITQGNKLIDGSYTRFGWRQVKLQGRDLLLNGQRIQLYGDLVHPFSAFVMSRRYAWAWYRMVKDFGGNAVRLHAQPLPRFYLDMADEMGIMVLDETALFGSSLQLNFNEPIAWERFAKHYDDLIMRDRNHPSVFGWSFGNELFAIFDYNKVPQAESDRWHAQLTALGLRERQLDPTRAWISCDGDEDLRGTLPVWSRHLGHGLHLDAIADVDKPRMIGESGGTYYAFPPLMAEFNGERAYESYQGRNEALAIDLYQNVTKMARPLLTFYSASETVWFGLEPLAYGYHDFSRLPNADDGVVFTQPYAEGKPGYQLEHIAPYVATLNPGWDANLPVYKPLPMFEAMKAALAPGSPAPSPWDHRPTPVTHPAPMAPTITKVAFQGATDGKLYRNLFAWGTPLGAGASADAGMLIIDGSNLASDDVPQIKQRIAAVTGRGGIALVMLGGKDATLENVNRLLPAVVELTTRTATMLVPQAAHPWTAPLGLPDLYFAQDPDDKLILKRGLSGPFVAGAKTLLEAANIDWSLFDAGENVKVGALTLYEQLQKPAGAALVVKDQGRGQIVLSAIDTSSAPTRATLWRKLLTDMGVKLEAPRANLSDMTGTAKEHDLLRDGPQK